MAARLLRRTRRIDDGGYSLTELLVAMGIFSILMAVVTTLLIQVTNESKNTLARVRTLEEAKLGVAQIDRQVRSGNVILDPALETKETSGVDKYYSMRIYTQEDTLAKCAQWRVIDHDGDKYGDLEFRTWQPGPSAVTGWTVVAHNLVEMNATATPDPKHPETWPPFWIDSTAASGTSAQFVRVTLRLRDPLERVGSKATSVTTVITGRNTVFGYPASSCANAPTP